MNLNARHDRTWCIYDSLYTKLADFKPFFRAITTEIYITVSRRHVKKQKGSNDCALFALAFDTSIRYGESTESSKSLFSIYNALTF